MRGIIDFLFQPKVAIAPTVFWSFFISHMMERHHHDKYEHDGWTKGYNTAQDDLRRWTVEIVDRQIADWQWKMRRRAELRGEPDPFGVPPPPRP